MVSNVVGRLASTARRLLKNALKRARLKSELTRDERESGIIYLDYFSFAKSDVKSVKSTLKVPSSVL